MNVLNETYLFEKIVFSKFSNNFGSPSRYISQEEFAK